LDSLTQLRFIGKPVDGLSLKDRWAITGSWIATKLYSPQTLPLRIMEAVGPTAAACLKQLQQRGLDPTDYHYELLAAPYEELEP
jgi:hypothetical protein